MSTKESKHAATAAERIAEAEEISRVGGGIVFDASEEVRKVRSEMFAEDKNPKNTESTEI